MSKRRTSRGTSSRRRTRRNAIEKKKALMTGGAVLIGSVVAYAIWKSTASAQAPTLPGEGTPGALSAAEKAAECAALQTRLTGLRSQPEPDPAALVQLEAQVAACYAELRAAGGEAPPAESQLSTGDQKFARIEQWFAEYRTTEYSDALKRNNIRQEMLRAGAEMATAYAAAVTASLSNEMTLSIRRSIIRAIDASISRRLCYLYDQQGCGRFAVNEDNSDDKAAQIEERVIRPLLAAQSAAVTKLGGPASVGMAGGTTVLIGALLRVAAVANEYTDRKFAEYKTVDYSDALRRNNLRQDVLRGGRATVGGLQAAAAATQSFGDLLGMRAVGTLLLAAFTSATTRWLCYLLDQPGCGRFAVNEDHGNDKAVQEMSATVTPLSTLYMSVGTSLVQNGDVTAFEAFINAKLRVCTVLSDFVNAKFAEYKSVSYSDAVRRNNLRQVVLALGRVLAARLADAETSAVAGAQVVPVAVVRKLATQTLALTPAQRAAAMSRGTTALPGGFDPGELLRRLGK